jgi:hypothetical protein
VIGVVISLASKDLNAEQPLFEIFDPALQLSVHDVPQKIRVSFAVPEQGALEDALCLIMYRLPGKEIFRNKLDRYAGPWPSQYWGPVCHLKRFNSLAVYTQTGFDGRLPAF